MDCNVKDDYYWKVKCRQKNTSFDKLVFHNSLMVKVETINYIKQLMTFSRVFIHNMHLEEVSYQTDAARLPLKKK